MKGSLSSKMSQKIRYVFDFLQLDDCVGYSLSYWVYLKLISISWCYKEGVTISILLIAIIKLISCTIDENKEIWKMLKCYTKPILQGWFWKRRKKIYFLCDYITIQIKILSLIVDFHNWDNSLCLKLNISAIC